MTLDEAKKLLNCDFDKDLADILDISPAAISKWDKEEIPQLRAYQVREKYNELKVLSSHVQNLPVFTAECNI